MKREVGFIKHFLRTETFFECTEIELNALKHSSLRGFALNLYEQVDILDSASISRFLDSGDTFISTVIDASFETEQGRQTTAAHRHRRRRRHRRRQPAGRFEVRRFRWVRQRRRRISLAVSY